jgi:RNA-directed DNA polymerase
MPNSSLPIALATAFLGGEQHIDSVVARASETIGQDWRWLRPLARRYLEAFQGKTRPRYREVVQFLLHDEGLQHARAKHALSVKHWVTELHPMQPVAAAADWDIPPIESIGALRDWLQLDMSELEWLADLKGLGYRQNGTRLQHYHYKVLSKRSGDIRLIESPKAHLKEVQRQILTRILDRIPVHPAVHGFRRRRSIKTYAARHVARRVVLRMDVENFFPTFSGTRIQTFFRTAGYPEPVADLLGGICTNAVPRGVWEQSYFDIDAAHRREARDLYARPHLPQGAPTSPMLANLCAYRIDCRLSGLAVSAAAEYTRYADDLAFSGDDAFHRRVDRFSEHVAPVLLEEGFRAHHRKTRIMRSGTRQYLVGLVINQKMNLVRKDLDTLKAILTNCIRSGPESQNRDAHPAFRSHLEGRIAFAEMMNPTKGARLRNLFEKIQWQ